MQLMYECNVCVLSVVQQEVRSLVFCCFCSVRFVGALSGDCGSVSMMCMWVSICACYVYMCRGESGLKERCLKERLPCSLKGFGLFMSTALHSSCD